MTTNDATPREALVEKYNFECKAYSARRALEDAVEDAMKRMFPSDEGDYVVTVHKVADRAVPEPGAVHAVHEAIVNNAPDWIIDREDGELFDMARAALAVVRELDADAIEAAAKAIHEFRYQNGDEPRSWDGILKAEMKYHVDHGSDWYRQLARAALTALQETHFIQTFDEAEHGARETFNGGYELGREHEAAAVEPAADAVYDLDTPWALVEEVRSHLNYFLADVNKDGTTEGQIRISAEYAAAMIATVKGHIRKGLRAAAVEPEPGLDAVEWEEIHISKGDDGTGVVIEVEGVPDSRGRHVVIATGATLGEAIAAAVRQATENGDG